MRDPVPKKVLEGLAKVPLFSACDKEELRRVARLGTETVVPDGTVLAEQQKPGFEFCLVLDGEVRCLIDDKLVATIGAGDFFGEMALIDRGPRVATIVAAGPVRLLVFDAREFGTLLDTAPTIAKKVLQSFATRVRANASIRH
jgi:CRP/FNR family transcriptional regulator, cyclic AMP receptor protein